MRSGASLINNYADCITFETFKSHLYQPEKTTGTTMPMACKYPAKFQSATEGAMIIEQIMPQKPKTASPGRCPGMHRFRKKG
jgi:hypothetical protein